VELHPSILSRKVKEEKEMFLQHYLVGKFHSGLRCVLINIKLSQLCVSQSQSCSLSSKLLGKRHVGYRNGYKNMFLNRFLL